MWRSNCSWLRRCRLGWCSLRQAIWLRLLLDDLQLGLGDKPFPILNDIAGTIALSKNPVHHERSKHIGLRHHFLRERVDDHTISLSHVPSADNIVDLLTKGLPRESFDRLRDLLGVTSRSDRVGVVRIRRSRHAVTWLGLHSPAPPQLF